METGVNGTRINTLIWEAISCATTVTLAETLITKLLPNAMDLILENIILDYFYLSVEKFKLPFLSLSNFKCSLGNQLAF